MNDAKLLDEARADIDKFYADARGVNAPRVLEIGLAKLNDIYESRDVGKGVCNVIENIMARLYQDLVMESDRLRKVEPLATLIEAEHWLNVMRSLGYAGWPYSSPFLESAKELKRLIRIVTKWGGHITKEERDVLFNTDDSFLDELSSWTDGQAKPS